jgi:hypothetical protein
MRCFTLCCAVTVLAGCARSEQQAAKDTTAAAMSAGVPSSTISLADVAGTWAMRGVTEDGKSTVVNYELVATPDNSGWTINFPKRDPIPMHVVAVAGDSIVLEAGPYESVLRKGVQVTTHSVARLQDGHLVGTVVARYTTTGPDSVVQLRFEGTRAY